MRVLSVSLLSLFLLLSFAPVAFADSACDFGELNAVCETALGTAGRCNGSKVCVPGQTTSLGGGNTGGNTTGLGGGNTGITLVNPLGANSNLTTLLTSVLGFVVRIGAIVVVLMLVYVGYLFVVAQGNESKLTEAKKALLWTVIGALILLGAQAIALGIQATVQALGTGT